MSQDSETISTNTDIKQFYNQYKAIVRTIIVTVGDGHGEFAKKYGTGFVADKDGSILTSAHIFPDSKSIKSIEVQRLDEEIDVVADLKRIYGEWDIALIAIRDVKFDATSGEYGVFPQDNSLSAGQTVVNIGNYDRLAGSIAIGRVGYPCSGRIDQPCYPPKYCKDSFLRVCESTEYRTMVDFWHNGINPKEMTFEGELHADLAVIHIHGFPYHRSSNPHFVGSSSGGPVFNFKGEVVGMVAMPYEKCVVAIHFRMLKMFISHYKKQKAREEKRKPRAKGSSSQKKARAKREAP